VLQGIKRKEAGRQHTLPPGGKTVFSYGFGNYLFDLISSSIIFSFISISLTMAANAMNTCKYLLVTITFPPFQGIGLIPRAPDMYLNVIKKYYLVNFRILYNVNVADNLADYLCLSCFGIMEPEKISVFSDPMALFLVDPAFQLFRVF
jgi:hypothetical protein